MRPPGGSIVTYKCEGRVNCLNNDNFHDDEIMKGYKCRLVKPSEESLEAGLSRELQEELGAAVPVTMDDYVSSHLAQSPPRLILHFYIKKITEPELLEIERAAVSNAVDHGLEVTPHAFI